MKRATVLWLLATAVAAPVGGQPAPSPTVRAQDLTDAEMEAFLTEGEIVRTRGAGTGITGSLRTTLRHRGVVHDAHIQTIEQTKPVGNLSAGVEIDFRDSYRHNVAAYHLDRLLGLGMVPVTVVRPYLGKGAAFTWWVDDVAMAELQRLDKKIKVPDVEAWNHQMFAVRIFDQLIYNFDRNLGNLLIDTSWRIWMIDHTRAFKIFKELKTPANLKNRCPRGLLEGLRRLDLQALEARMKGILTNGQLVALLARRDLIVRYFDQRIAALGEVEVLYDLPPRLTAPPGPP